VAVDGNGFAYVSSGNANLVIAVAKPGAAGTASQRYSVRPVRVMHPGQPFFAPWPSNLAAGLGNDVLAAVVDRSNAILTFAGGATGSGGPIRVLSGAKTGLGSCGIGFCDRVVVTFSSLTQLVYVAVSSGTSSHISAFRWASIGNVAPLRTIQGSATGLAGHVVTGLAVSPTSGDVYAMVKPSLFAGPAHMAVFSRNATGNVAPVRTFTDTASGFANAMGIAINQFTGPATNLGISVKPRSMPADGRSTATVTAALTSAFNLPRPSDAVRFASSDSRQHIGTVMNHGNGTYSATITASTTAGTAIITARDLSVTPNLTASTPLVQTQTTVVAVHAVAAVHLAGSSTTSTTTPTAQPAAAGSSPATLPLTGSSPVGLTAVGAGLLVAGTGMVAVVRRRRSSAAEP
jgi:LPXTG-motif cell wall-anchored protein